MTCDGMLTNQTPTRVPHEGDIRESLRPTVGLSLPASPPPDPELHQRGVWRPSLLLSIL